MLWKKLVQFGKGFFERKEESTSTDMPLGTAMHNIEITRGRGGQLARAAGAVAKLIAKESKSATLRLPSGEVRLVSQHCLATVGQVGNVGVNQKSLGRAGSKCWLIYIQNHSIRNSFLSLSVELLNSHKVLQEFFLQLVELF